MSRSDGIPVIVPYNPLDKRNLGASVAREMLASEAHPLPPESFIGAGVYALYYRGDFAPYRKLAAINADAWNVPIYVGKAVPAGARKGGLGISVDHGFALENRLNDHRDSIEAAVNLNVEDFACRFLVVDDIWIPLTESLLIERFRPLWNWCLDGFGNHDPGRGRHQQQRSPWDCVHPGREWAARLQNNAHTTEEMLIRIATYLDTL